MRKRAVVSTRNCRFGDDAERIYLFPCLLELVLSRVILFKEKPKTDFESTLSFRGLAFSCCRFYVSRVIAMAAVLISGPAEDPVQLLKQCFLPLGEQLPGEFLSAFRPVRNVSSFFGTCRNGLPILICRLTNDFNCSIDESSPMAPRLSGDLRRSESPEDGLERSCTEQTGEYFQG